VVEEEEEEAEEKESDGEKVKCREGLRPSSGFPKTSGSPSKGQGDRGSDSAVDIS
jgi:hypothetical protein